MPWFGLDGTQIDAEQARELMADTEGRTLAVDTVRVRPGLTVEVRTVFVCHAETDDDGNPITPLYETASTILETTVEPHMTPGAAKQGHGLTVQRFRAAAARTGAHAAGAAPPPPAAATSSTASTSSGAYPTMPAGAGFGGDAA